MPVTWPGVGSFPTGDAALHLVSTDWDGTEADIPTATWLVVDGVGEKTQNATAQTTSHAMFGRAAAVTTVGIPDQSIGLTGWHAEGDAGQEALRAVMPGGANAGASIGYLNIRDRNTGKGFATMVKVGGGGGSQNASGGLQPLEFTLAPQTDPIPVTDFELGEGS